MSNIIQITEIFLVTWYI